MDGMLKKSLNKKEGDFLWKTQQLLLLATKEWREKK